jgi:cytochrome P450
MALLDSDRTTLKAPPVAPGEPFVGSFRGLLRDPLDTMYQAYRRMGPVFRVKAPTRDYVVLAGPEANLFFLQHGDELLEGGPVYHPYAEDLGTDRVLVAMDGSSHRAYKKVLKRGLSREALTPHLGRMADEVIRAARSWQAGDAINVPDTMQFFASQMMGLGLAGCPVDHNFEAVKKFAHTFLGAGVGGFPNFFRKLPAYQRAREATFEFVRAVIEHHRENPPGKQRAPDLIDMLLEQTREDGQPLSEMDLIASSHLPFTNSLVYAGALAGFMLYELLRHPDVLKKVREEADLLFAEGEPDARALRSARTLRGALMETQRLHPIALSIPRIVKEPFEFEGYLLDKGTVTLTATAVTHLLPEYFPGADDLRHRTIFPATSTNRSRCSCRTGWARTSARGQARWIR